MLPVGNDAHGRFYKDQEWIWSAPELPAASVAYASSAGVDGADLTAKVERGVYDANAPPAAGELRVHDADASTAGEPGVHYADGSSAGQLSLYDADASTAGQLGVYNADPSSAGELGVYNADASSAGTGFPMLPLANIEPLDNAENPALTYARLALVQPNCIRAETLTRANARLDAQTRILLAQAFGGRSGLFEIPMPQKNTFGQPTPKPCSNKLSTFSAEASDRTIPSPSKC